MTGQDLIDYIQEHGLHDWPVDAKFHGTVFEILDAGRVDGSIRLYPTEEEE